MVLISFSFLYTINISLSNISLRLVTVPVRLPIFAALRFGRLAKPFESFPAPTVSSSRPRHNANFHNHAELHVPRQAKRA